MYFLASDYLAGRVAHKAEFEVAVQYCASQFKSVGLQPGAFSANGEPSFFQDVPLQKTVFEGENSVTIIRNNETVILENLNDFKMPMRNTKFPENKLEVVFAGYGIEEPEYDWNDFEDIDILCKSKQDFLSYILEAGKKYENQGFRIAVEDVEDHLHVDFYPPNAERLNFRFDLLDSLEYENFRLDPNFKRRGQPSLLSRPFALV